MKRPFSSSRVARLGAALLAATAMGAGCVARSLAEPLPATPLSMREVAITHDTLGPLTVFAPPKGSDPQAFVIVLDDDQVSEGSTATLTPARLASIQRLVARGAAVVPIQARAALDLVAKSPDSTDDCLDLLGEFAGVSTLGQRALGNATYRWPVLLGDGETGGTLAYLALAQSPVNTIAGAVSLALDPTLDSAKPLCAGATATTDSPGRFSYAPSTDLPQPWIAIGPSGGGALSDKVLAFLKADPDDTQQKPGGSSDEDRLREAEEAALSIGTPAPTGIEDLPVVELPAQSPPGAPKKTPASRPIFAILVSGDGGWRDIDKSIAEELAAQGISVVGLDSLRYFWSYKSPETYAKDLDRIAAHYGTLWHAELRGLLGYSMGADAMPFAWDHLSQKTRDRVRLIGLVGFEPTAAFEISIAGFAGIASAQDVDVRPPLKSLPLDRVICVYGTDEQADGSTGCTLPEMKGATLMERPGGHHLDGEYETVAKAFIDRLR